MTTINPEPTKYFRSIIELEFVTPDGPIPPDVEIDELNVLMSDGITFGRITRAEASEINYRLASALIAQSGVRPEHYIGPPEERFVVGREVDDPDNALMGFFPIRDSSVTLERYPDGLPVAWAMEDQAHRLCRRMNGASDE
jgi:hypothetical protein